VPADLPWIHRDDGRGVVVSHGTYAPTKRSLDLHAAVFDTIVASAVLTACSSLIAPGGVPKWRH
jgi:hypothetical protein